MERKTIIALKGKGEIGKTSAIKILIGRFQISGYEVNIVDKKEGEVLAKVHIDGQDIGITTRGDNEKCLVDDFDELGKCDKYVCACRSKGQTLHYLYQHDSTIIRAQGKERDFPTECEWANSLFDAIVKKDIISKEIFDKYYNVAELSHLGDFCKKLFDFINDPKNNVWETLKDINDCDIPPSLGFILKYPQFKKDYRKILYGEDTNKRIFGKIFGAIFKEKGYTKAQPIKECILHNASIFRK